MDQRICNSMSSGTKDVRYNVHGSKEMQYNVQWDQGCAVQCPVGQRMCCTMREVRRRLVIIIKGGDNAWQIANWSELALLVMGLCIKVKKTFFNEYMNEHACNNLQKR